MQFTLSITLGNAEMSRDDAVSDALHRVADQVEQHGLIDEVGPNSFPIYDANGEPVGKWEVSE